MTSIATQPTLGSMKEALTSVAASGEPSDLAIGELHFTRAALDRLPTAVLLFSRWGEVSFANRAAIALLGQRDGLALQMHSPRHLVFASRDDQERFEFELASLAARRQVAGAKTGLRVARPSNKPDYVIQIKALEHHGDEEDRVLVIVTDPCEHHRLDARLLASVYSMTAAEARLAEALLGDDTLCEIAAGLGIKESTVRSQLLGIFRKTRTSRQAQLIKVLMGLRSVR